MMLFNVDFAQPPLMFQNDLHPRLREHGTATSKFMQYTAIIDSVTAAPGRKLEVHGRGDYQKCCTVTVQRFDYKLAIILFSSICYIWFFKARSLVTPLKLAV